MLQLFHYNWQVRDEWLEWCRQLTQEELLGDRIGGVGSILKTLFHIVDKMHPHTHNDFSRELGCGFVY